MQMRRPKREARPEERQRETPREREREKEKESRARALKAQMLELVAARSLKRARNACRCSALGE